MAKKFMILTPGRAGSSLLCAVLADCGADFGLPVPDRWDRDEGALEHRGRYRLARHVESPLWAYAPAAGPLRRARHRWHRARGKRLVRRFWSRVDYLKGLVSLVPASLQAGIDLRIILNIREPAACLGALVHQHRGHRLYDDHRESYRRILLNGLAFLPVAGGCVVDFDDLVGNADRAGPLAEVTGLPVDALLRARDARLAGPPRTKPTAFFDDDALTRLYRAARDMIPNAQAPR